MQARAVDNKVTVNLGVGVGCVRADVLGGARRHCNLRHPRLCPAPIAVQSRGIDLPTPVEQAGEGRQVGG